MLESSSFCVASSESSVRGIPQVWLKFKSSVGTAGLTHSASGMGVKVALGIGDGDGEGTGVLAGTSVVGTHAARRTSTKKRAENFFICLFCHKIVVTTFED